MGAAVAAVWRDATRTSDYVLNSGGGSVMVGDNIIIHGATVAQWKQLAIQFNQPHGTAEELADFIDAYQHAARKDFFSEQRQAERAQDIHNLECEVMELLQRMEELCTEAISTEQLQYLENELPPFSSNLMKAANVKAFKA